MYIFFKPSIIYTGMYEAIIVQHEISNAQKSAVYQILKLRLKKFYDFLIVFLPVQFLKKNT